MNMKRNLFLSFAVAFTLIVSSVFAEEITPNDIIPDINIAIPEEIKIQEEEIIPDIVIPAQAGIQDNEFPVEEIFQINSFEMSSDDEGELIEEIIVPASTTASTTASSTDSSATSTVTIVSTSTVNLFIRNGAEVIFDGEAEIPTEDEWEVIDNKGISRTISSQSVLAVLMNEDIKNDNFEITNIKYYEDYSSHYLMCIKISDTEFCDDWQYVVDGFSPWSSIDSTYLNGDERVALYFGNPFQLILEKNTFELNSSIVVRAHKYDYLNNIWNPRTNINIGLATPTFNWDTWMPEQEFEVKMVDEEGLVTLSASTTGEFIIGVQEDGYYPSYSITISSTTASTTATSTDNTTVGGGGGSSSTNKDFSVSNAINFLKSKQKENGSFANSELYSDWAAISFAAAGQSNSALINYLESDSNIKSVLTDNVRRAMALLAMKKNPYTFGNTNYIEAIIKDFDGTQFGEKNLINDDIFSILVLSKVGYDSSDIEIQKSIEFIIKKQNPNGSWENSTDLTASAIQSLIEFKDISGVSFAISKAKNYLKNSQQNHGGWEDVYSTSWALQAMSALSESWSKEGKTPQDYLASNQKDDGGLLNIDESDENRIWATSYAIPAALQMSWNDILKSVSRPKDSVVTSGGSNDTNATSTSPSIATSTDSLIASSTEEFVLEEIPETATTSVIALAQFVNENNFEDDLENDSKENIDTEISSTTSDSLAQNQLAAVGQIYWFKSLWAYVAGGFVSVFSALKSVLNFR